MKVIGVMIDKATFDATQEFILLIGKLSNPLFNAEELFSKNSKEYKARHLKFAEDVKEMIASYEFSKVFRNG